MDRKEIFENYLSGAAGYLEKEDFRNARKCLSLAKELLVKELPKAKDRKSLAEAWNRLSLAFLHLYNKAMMLNNYDVMQEAYDGHNSAFAVSRSLAEGKKGQKITEICLKLYKTEWSKEEITELEQKLEKDRENEELVCQLAQAYRHAGRAEDALKLLEKRIAKTGKNHRLLEELGHVYFQLGHHDEANRIYKRILNEVPGHRIRGSGKNWSIRLERGSRSHNAPL